MLTLIISASIACWLVLYLPKIKGWFEDRAMMARYRELMRNYVPMPYKDAPIEEWKSYLDQATRYSSLRLQGVVNSCCDKKRKPKPEYVELVQLLKARIHEFSLESDLELQKIQEKLRR